MGRATSRGITAPRVAALLTVGALMLTVGNSGTAIEPGADGGTRPVAGAPSAQDVPDQTGSDQTGPNQTGPNQTGSGRAGSTGRPAEPGVLWDGGFEAGGVPPGRNGPSCGTGSQDASAEYRDVEEMGNSACTSSVAIVARHTRTPDSRRSLKVTLGRGQQREQPQSTYSWKPDGDGTADLWYGFSILYAPDWNEGGGIDEEVSDAAWHNPVAFRMVGDNGSLNLSGDMDLNNGNGEPFERFSEPHMVLRRNTVKNNQGFYRDGQGLDKLDLGPIVVNRWMDFVCHIQWSTTDHNAFRSCWRDGKHMGTRTTVNAVDARTHYLRIGQYQTTAIDHPRTTYYDNVRIGTSYRAVDPSRTR